MSVFQRFDFENDVVENQRVVVSSGIFSGGDGVLEASQVFTQSNAGSITGSYLDIFHQDPNVGRTIVYKI